MKSGLCLELAGHPNARKWSAARVVLEAFKQTKYPEVLSHRDLAYFAVVPSPTEGGDDERYLDENDTITILSSPDARQRAGEEHLLDESMIQVLLPFQTYLACAEDLKSFREALDERNGVMTVDELYNAIPGSTTLSLVFRNRAGSQLRLQHIGGDNSQVTAELVFVS